MLSIQQIHDQIVQPTLISVALDSRPLTTFLSLSMMPSIAQTNELFGPLQITSDLHRSVWDNHLALDPDKASAVRGLASQRRFLETPDLELNLNWGYAVAITANLIEMRSRCSILELNEPELETIWFHQCLQEHHAKIAKDYYMARKSDHRRRPFAA